MPKYRITTLIDVVSSNPEDYTLKYDIVAIDPIWAIKGLAISMTRKDSSNIDWINNHSGTIKELMNDLMGLGYCFTHIVEL